MLEFPLHLSFLLTSFYIASNWRNGTPIYPKALLFPVRAPTRHMSLCSMLCTTSSSYFYIGHSISEVVLMGTNLLFLAVVKHRKRSLVIAAELFSNHFLDHESFNFWMYGPLSPPFFPFGLCLVPSAVSRMSRTPLCTYNSHSDNIYSRNDTSPWCCGAGKWPH